MHSCVFLLFFFLNYFKLLAEYVVPRTNIDLYDYFFSSFFNIKGVVYTF